MSEITDPCLREWAEALSETGAQEDAETAQAIHGAFHEIAALREQAGAYEAGLRRREEEIAAQRAEIQRMCEERDSAQRCIEKLTTERDEAVRGRLDAEKSIAAKRTALTKKDAALRLAAVRLDAMAWVWCGGGCDSVFIKPENKPLRPLTFEMVREAAHGVERLLAHYAMRTVRRLEPAEEPDETRRAIWAATAAEATAAQSIRDIEARVAALEAVVRAARAATAHLEARAWDSYRTDSDGFPVSDERLCGTCGAFAQDGWRHESDCAFERDRRALDAALAALEVPRG